MRLVAIVVPTFLQARPKEGTQCCCGDQPIETAFKSGVIHWLKQSGDAVAEGEALCTLEIEKRVAELPAPVSGVLQEQVIAEGESFDARSIFGYIKPER